MGNPIVHFELVGDDPEALADYYTSLFDWKIDKQPGEMAYWVIDTGQPPMGGIMAKMHPEQTQLDYVLVDSVDESAAKAQELGGMVVVPRTEIEGMGWFAVIVDPQGNGIGVYEEMAGEQQ